MKTTQNNYLFKKKNNWGKSNTVGGDGLAFFDSGSSSDSSSWSSSSGSSSSSSDEPCFLLLPADGIGFLRLAATAEDGRPFDLETGVDRLDLLLAVGAIFLFLSLLDFLS